MTRSPALWFTLLGIAFVLLIARLVIAYRTITRSGSQVANGENALTFLVVVAVVALLVVSVGVLLYRRGQDRNAYVRRRNPSALLIVTSLSPGMASIITGLRPGTKVRSALVWAIDRNGASLWQGGGHHPVEVFTLAKGNVLSIHHEILNVGSRDFDAVSFYVMDPRGFERPLRFFVRPTTRPFIPLGAAGVDATIAEINRMWQSSPT